MTAKNLYQAGKLKEAIQALNAEVRDNPGDTRRRTFLFELLTFAGEYDRAQKQLQVLAGEGSDAQMGTVLYLSALHAEKTRKETFFKGEYPPLPAGGGEVSGEIDGQPFTRLLDADPRIGPRLECYAAGAYIWIPFEHIEEIEAQAPRRVRDLIWIPALVRTGPAFQAMELGEVLLPALTWDASGHKDDEVRLGRVTNWYENELEQSCPVGQKMLLVDGEEFPILELRKLTFHQTQHASS